VTACFAVLATDVATLLTPTFTDGFVTVPPS
jgi:hypothetical protein